MCILMQHIDVDAAQRRVEITLFEWLIHAHINTHLIDSSARHCPTGPTAQRRTLSHTAPLFEISFIAHSP
jgi:hypothetical protein